MGLEIATANSSPPMRPTVPLPQVEAELNYLAPMAEKPYTYLYEPPIGVAPHNLVYESHRLPIYNGRSISSALSLNHQGFQFISHRSAVSNLYDETEIRQRYYPEAEALVKSATAATSVFVFDHNLRNTLQARQGVSGVREPVKRVHNDFTAQSGYRRSRDELVAMGIEHPDALLQQRFSIINVWRPITHPVEESPLAVCDARSIASSDWVSSDLIYRDRVGETYLATYNRSHQWFYFPQMQPDEVLLIKCFDSAENSPARFTAHTAFDDPTSPPDAVHRSSIELRTLVIY